MGDTTNELISVRGMCCTHCVHALKDELLRLGLEKVTVRMGEAEVTYDPGLVPRSRIEEAVEDAGFEVMTLLREEQVEQVKRYVREHLSDPEAMRLSVMSRAVAVSPSHLSRTFSVNEGETIQDFIARMRMERAAALLAETERTVIDIAGEVGLSSPSHFAKQFKRHFGVTPHVYRQDPERRNGPRALSKIARDMEDSATYLRDVVLGHVHPMHGTHHPRKRSR